MQKEVFKRIESSEMGWQPRGKEINVYYFIQITGMAGGGVNNCNAEKCLPYGMICGKIMLAKGA